ncbi:hypothetical protein CHCC14820_1478 [Bacillus paralicheniformis]|nr:hypothetical protein CHCC5022_3906 [Bacillus paralicheniformis]TWJ72643.1 hypothetical protein CHCC4186_2028 [Bacillus paralicheniformis]TWK85370.1 hypothetical protein CHCC20333_3249 [Bacillus paralicheniformis]TWK89049.1 hypothetical protein CHCC20331_1451 [Bacillus paralicheniformis]TWM29622.1 hypothetical protein CHCC14820_1478 [Bacillus paralicheniformis]
MAAFLLPCKNCKRMIDIKKSKNKSRPSAASSNLIFYFHSNND